MKPDPQISDALVRYVGQGLLSYPQLDMGRALAVLNEESRDRVQSLLEAIFHFADSVNPDWKNCSLWEGSCHIARRTQQQFPELDEAATMALAWSYSYWWK